MQKGYDKLGAGRTTIIISYPLITIISVEIIYVVDRGKVIEKGYHLQLMSGDTAANKRLVNT